MIRKFAIAAAAIAALGTASLTATTPANAGGGKGGGWGGGFHHNHGFRGGFGLGLYAVDSCYKDVIVINRRGERVLKTINVCD
jgi:hypothetical protein